MKRINFVKYFVITCLGLSLFACNQVDPNQLVTIEPTSDLKVENTMEVIELSNETNDSQKETTYPEPVVLQRDPYPVGSQDMDITDTVQPYGNDITITPAIKNKIEATDPKTFKLVDDRYQLVEFFAFWCPTCQSVAPVVHSLEVTYKDKIKFVYLDIDDPDTEEFKKALGFRYQPHFILLDSQGVILQQWVGYVSLEEFQAYFQTLQ